MSEAAQATPELCRCGRVLGHTGRHAGGLSPSGRTHPDPENPKPSNNGEKLRLLLGKEIAACQQSIGRMKAAIRALHAKLEVEQAKLPPLLQCQEALSQKRIAPPDYKPTATAIFEAQRKCDAFQTTARREVPMVVEEPEPEPQGDDTILATYGTVLKFAMTRGLKFECWDDLPTVNRKREALNMPTFKRDLSDRTKPGGRGNGG